MATSYTVKYVYQDMMVTIELRQPSRARPWAGGIRVCSRDGTLLVERAISSAAGSTRLTVVERMAYAEAETLIKEMLDAARPKSISTKKRSSRKPQSVD